MTDIAMLSCNRKRITEICITEIKRRTTTPHRLIVVDNGSTDGSQEMLRGLQDRQIIDRLVCMDTNTGVHCGHNALLDLVSSDPYISTDNDLVPCVPIDGVDWLSRLLKLGVDNPQYGAIACRPHILIGEGRDLFDIPGDIRERGHVGAHLRLMRTAEVRRVGGWQKNQRPSRNHEERWICGKLREAGLKVGYSRNIRAIHLWGDPELGEDSWGYTAGTYHEGHREVWPPPHHFSWDRQGIDWATCQKIST